VGGGGRIVDAEGRQVLLRGVNVNALAEYWQGGEYPTVFPLSADDADQMRALGWSTVRLLLSWSRVEPAPGAYDAVYLDDVRAAVRLLASRGLYSIIDLHQDAFSATLAAPAELSCTPPAVAALGWDGAPGWATLDEGASRCVPLGVRELSPAVMKSWENFFLDAPGPGGVGIRTRYVAMLAHVAGALGAAPGVAGYDLMNEPGAFAVAQQTSLSAMYGEAVAAIRAAERAAGSPPRLILFEPSALWSLTGRGAPPAFAHDDGVVYAPHLYTGGFNGGPITAAAFEVAREEAKGFGGAPVLTGEWGADPRRASDPEDPYFLEHQRLQDELVFGATLWTWRESCGDPHKQADYRAGNIPYVWGEFEVDCSSNTITGARTDLLAQLARGYLRAAPGQLIASRWNPATGQLTASGEAAEAGTELLAFYPLTDRPFSVSAAGLDDVQVHHSSTASVHITARARSGAWAIEVVAGDP
ncbi:MAG: cellulase family glycosylhydrolase, partial [Candidatus Binatia bacterium]